MKIEREEFFGRKILVHDVSQDARRDDGRSTGIWDHGEHVLPNDIIIGLSPTNFHAFLRTNVWEVHPRFSFNRIKVLKAREGAVRAQLFLRLRGLDKNTVEKLNQTLPLLLGKRTLSCIEGVRQALIQGADLHLSQHTQSDLYISQFIYQVLSRGISNKYGQKLQVDVFKARQKSLAKLFKELTFAESCFNPIGIASYYWYQINVKRSKDKLEVVDGPQGPGFFENQWKNFNVMG